MGTGSRLWEVVETEREKKKKGKREKDSGNHRSPPPLLLEGCHLQLSTAGWVCESFSLLSSQAGKKI